jgi:hypothetical protein
MKSKRLRWAGFVARPGRGEYAILVEIPEGRSPLGRPSSKWEYNIKIYLRGVGWGGKDWIKLAQDGDR